MSSDSWHFLRDNGIVTCRWNIELCGVGGWVMYDSSTDTDYMLVTMISKEKTPLSPPRAFCVQPAVPDTIQGDRCVLVELHCHDDIYTTYIMGPTLCRFQPSKLMNSKIRKEFCKQNKIYFAFLLTCKSIPDWLLVIP